MRRLFYVLGCLLPLSFGTAALAADQDPPHTHYAVAHMPADPALAAAPSVGRYRGYLRQSVDLTRLMPPVGDQGELPSGIAWALAYAARSYYAGRNEGRNIDSPENEASPGYVFHLARRGACDDGATITNAVSVLEQGALSLAAYPYKASCQEPPGPSQVSNASDFRVKGYRVLDRSRIDDVKGQLERGNPVIVPFRVSLKFEDFRGKGTFDEIDFAQPGGEDNWQVLAVIGYDDARQAVRVMNSWGRGWGDEGYAWISYAALTNRISGAVVLDVATAANSRPDQPTAPSEPDVKPQEHSEMDSDPAPPDPASPSTDQPAAVAHALSPPRQPTLADVHSLQCAKITETVSRGHVTLAGFVATDADLAMVREVAAHGHMSVGDVKIAPWPLCEALDTLEKPLKSELHPGLSISPSGIAKGGETLRVDLHAPSKPSYLYLAYFAADRTVITLVQPQGRIQSQTPPGSKLIFGDGRAGRAKFTVSPPYGNEMLIAIASASPLFDTKLPQRQSEREFLSNLRKALIYKPSANLHDRQVGAAIATLQTRAD